MRGYNRVYALLAIHPQLAAVLLHNLLGGEQAQPRAGLAARAGPGRGAELLK